MTRSNFVARVRHIGFGILAAVTLAALPAVRGLHAQSSGAPAGTPAPAVVGDNVNMIEGPTFLRTGSRAEDLVIQGDPLQNANGFELSCAMSTRNPLHFLCFANDNRAVDIPGTDATGLDGDAS